MRFALLSVLLVICAMVHKESSAQSEIKFIQCASDKSLPIVAQSAQQKHGVNVIWDSYPPEEVRVKVATAILASSAPYDGIWGCPLDSMQDIIEGDFGASAFVPAEEFAAFPVPLTFFAPEQRWIPLTLDLGIACLRPQSPFKDDVRNAIEKDPRTLLQGKFQGRIGFPEPLTTDAGYNWLGSFADVLGADQIGGFAKDFIDGTKPVIGAGCREVAIGQIDVALSTWSDAFRNTGDVIAVFASNSWAEPTVFAVFASSSEIDSAKVVVAEFMDPEVKTQIAAAGSIPMPSDGTSISVQTAEGEESTTVVRGASSSENEDTEEVAAAATEASESGCKSNWCTTCPRNEKWKRRCRLCDDCK